MTVTEPDNLRTPDLGDPYNYTTDMAVLAQTVQDALTSLGIRSVASADDRDILYPSPAVGTKVYRRDTQYVEVYVTPGGWRPLHWGLSPTARPYALRDLRRSDGALAYNNGGTAFRWQGNATTNTLGLIYGTDGDGAFFKVPKAGLYRVTAQFLLAGSPGQNWASVSLSGGQALGITYEEAAWTGYYASASINADLQLSTDEKVWFPFTANNAGTLRTNIPVRVYPIY